MSSVDRGDPVWSTLRDLIRRRLELLGGEALIGLFPPEYVRGLIAARESRLLAERERAVQEAQSTAERGIAEDAARRARELEEWDRVGREHDQAVAARSGEPSTAPVPAPSGSATGPTGTVADDFVAEWADRVQSEREMDEGDDEESKATKAKAAMNSLRRQQARQRRAAAIDDGAEPLGEIRVARVPPARNARTEEVLRTMRESRDGRTQPAVDFDLSMEWEIVSFSLSSSLF